MHVFIEVVHILIPDSFNSMLRPVMTVNIYNVSKNTENTVFLLRKKTKIYIQNVNINKTDVSLVICIKECVYF